MRKIHEEDYSEHIERLQKVKDTKTAIGEYNSQRFALMEQNNRTLQQEEDRIQAYAQQQGAREASMKAAQEAKRAAEEETFRRIEADMQAKRAAAQEFESLRDLLWEEETENKLRMQEIAKNEARDEAKREMVHVNTMQKKLRENLRQIRAEEDEELMRQMRDKFSEDQRMDEEAKQRRIDERSVFQRRIAEEKKLRQGMYADEKAAEERFQLSEVEQQQYKQRVIDAARIRLLKEHAQALGGFLPKGVLSKPEDLELLSQFDTNGDGRLDAAEVASAKRAFMKHDLDGNGQLDQAEAKDALDSFRRGN